MLIRLWIGCVVFLLTGCSTQLAYNNVDWLAMRYIDDYVSLNRDQTSVLEQRLEYLHRWHQDRELTLYADHLIELKNITPEQVTPEFIDAQQAKIKQHWERLVDKAAPEVFSLLSQLTELQKQQLLKRLAEEYRERDDKYRDMSEQELRELYHERITEFAEEWLGSLTSEQESRVMAWSKQITITAPYWREYRAAYYQHIEQLLAPQDESQQIALLRRALYETDSFYSPELSAAMVQNQALFKGNIVALTKSMTDKQWRYYRSQIQDWYELAAELSMSAQAK